MKNNNEQNQDTVLQFDELIEVSDKKPRLTPVKDEKQVPEDNNGSNYNAEVTSNKPAWMEHLNLLAALFILAVLLVMEYGFKITLPKTLSFAINSVAYLLAGWSVLHMAFRKAKRGDIFNEFVLMSIATLGAFYIGAYSEGVAVMVFYTIGEWFQNSAVRRAKASIKALLDIRPDEVNVMRNGQTERVHSSEVQLEEIIQMKPGEKVALDGELISESSSFNTSALTGESRPDTKYKGEQVLAGMINLNTVSEVKVTALFKDSKLSKILEMVRDATARKSQTQLFISRFAKVYTPIVFFLALALVLIPYFFVANYVFNEWLYRGLVFLVISCPCALVVSIPLGYFGGIGLASRNGILFKGGNFMDVMTKVNTIVMDKTGTLTKGVFKVQKIVANGMDEKELIRLTAALEKKSTHPVAKAVVDYAGNINGNTTVTNVEEVAGHGLKGIIDDKKILAGNAKLMKKYNISFPDEIEELVNTVVLVAINNKYAGYITIADEIKEDATTAIKEMHELNLRTVMLSGDKQVVVNEVARELGIDEAYGDLLPEGKVEKVQQIKQEGKHIAFVGDGVNDAPVIALADVGIAMGGLGSDATIETADVVIQNDQPSKIVSAIKIGKITRSIVWQNISLAMGIKVIVLILGAGGIANLWEAVIADVGVALLAIMNAVRIQRLKL
ncbi:MAG: cadmium-translocating P-type ATPase [Bacteroidota bacterium]|nr:cadmium-translocating P-type ATPase [Bacteroidota bacterium]